MKQKLKSMLALLVALVCGGVWAATPVAKWSGSDFSSTQNGLTMNLNGNTVSGGAVTIGSNGLKITWTGTNPFGTDSGTQFFQALVRYADVPVPTANNVENLLVSLTNNAKNGDYLGVGVIAGGKLRGIWNNDQIYDNGSKGNDSNVANKPGVNTLVVSYTRKNNAKEGYNTTIEGTTAFVNGAIAYGNTGLKATYTVQDIIIGGRAGTNSKYATASGMKVLGVALFTEPLTVAEMNSFKFDNEADTINISEDTDWADNTEVGGKVVTINVAGTPTLTLGKATQIAALKVVGSGTLTIADAQNLTVSTILGSNIVLKYVNGDFPEPNTTTAAALASSNWSGTVRLEELSPASSKQAKDMYLYLEKFGNANSHIVLKGVSGYWINKTTIKSSIEIENNADDVGFNIVNGGSNGYTTFERELSGTGSLTCGGGSTQGYWFKKNSNFAGTVDTGTPANTSKCITFGGASGRSGNSPNTGKIFVDGSATIGSGKSWTAPNGIFVNGILAGSGTVNNNITFANSASIDVTGNAEDAAIALADNVSVTLGTALGLVGATDGSIILKNVAAAPEGLSTMLLTLNEEATVGRLVYKNKNLIFKTTDDSPYWKPNPAKKDANGIVNWTDSEAWLGYDGLVATWPEDGMIEGEKINVQFDPETEVKGISITGPVSVGEVSVVNTGANSNQFDFHNSTKDVDGEHEITGGDTHDCLTASAINLLAYNGRLGLKVPIVGTLTFGDMTKLVFETADPGKTASTAYAYTIGGRDDAIIVEGAGEFAIPAGMYGKSFNAVVVDEETPTIVINSTAALSGTIGGNGKIRIAADATLSGALTCTGGLDVGAHTVTINVAEGERTISTPITGTGLIKKTGAGTLIVNGNNSSFTGTWEVVGGTLKRGTETTTCFGPDSSTNNPTISVKVDSGATFDVNGLQDVTYGVVLNGGTLRNSGTTGEYNHKQLVKLTLEANSAITGANTFGIIPPDHGNTDEKKGILNLAGYTLTINMDDGGKEFMVDGLADTEAGGRIKIQRGKLLTANSQHRAADLSHSIIELAGGAIATHVQMTVKDVVVSTATTANQGSIKVLGNIEGKTFMMPNVTLGADALVKTVNDKGLNVTTALTLEGALRVSAYGATEKNAYVAVTAPNATLTAATIKMIGQDGTEVPNACAKAIVDNDLVVMRKLGGVSYVGMKAGALPSNAFTPIAVFDETYATDDIGTKLFVTSKSADGSFSTGKKNVPLRLVSNEEGEGVRALQFQILDGYLKCINVEVKAVAAEGGKTVVMAKKSGSGFVGNGTESTVEGQYGTKQTSLSSHGYDTTDFTVGNLDAANFTFDGNANTLSGWFTSWGGSAFTDADKVIGPNGKAARASKNDHRPWNSLNINNKEDYTISIYGSVDNVSVAAGKNGVIFAAGNCYSGEDVLALVKKPDGSVALTATGTNGGSIQSEALGAGYHLFTIVKEQGRVYSLYVDGEQIDSSTRWKDFTHNGDIQLAALPGGTKDDYPDGDNASYAMILGYDAALDSDNIAELAKKYPYVDTSAVTSMTVSDLNRAGTMFINSDATLTFDTDIVSGCAVANLSGEAVTLTLTTSGDKKFVSAADIKKLQLDANIKLDYGWTAHKVISVNYVWKSGNTILAKMAEGNSVETVDGTLGGLVKRSTWNDIVIDQNNNYVTDSADLTKMAVDGVTSTTISGVTATRYSRGTYRTKNGNNPLTTDIPFVNGYLDDLNTGDAVSITVSGIPFRTYDVVVYFQTDGSAHPTLQIVQGDTTTNYRYNDAKELVKVSGTGTWGTGNYNGFSYDANVMRVTNLNGHTVKVTTNKASGERSSIAAIQIVQMSTDAEDEEFANAVAFIGNEPYATLAQAITAAGEEATIIDLVKASTEDVVIPENVTVVPATISCKMTGAITGKGTIKLSWPNQDANPNVWYTTYFGDATLNGFTGTLHFASGRFQSNTTIPLGVKLNIANGAQLWLTGGNAWANAMTISGYGWSGSTGIEATKIRLNGGCEISGDITVLVVDDIIPTLGNYIGAATYSGTITAASGVKTYAEMNGTITLTAANLADVTSIEVTEGTLALDATENTTLSSVISGSGKVVKTGTGTLTLSGVNTFTGGLNIVEGTVKSNAGYSNTNSGFGNGASSTITVGENCTLDFNGKPVVGGYAINLAGTIDCSTDCNADWQFIRSLRIDSDTAKICGGQIGVATSGGETAIDLNGHILTVELSAATKVFAMNRTTVSGNGTFVLKKGKLTTKGTVGTCFTYGNLIIEDGASIYLNTDLTVNDVELKGGTIDCHDSFFIVNGTLTKISDTTNRTIAKLRMGNGATIKLDDACRIVATTAFEIGDSLNFDCSAVTDPTFDAIQVPAAFHTDANYAKIKAWIGSEYKVGNLSHPNGSWLRITPGDTPQTKPAEVVTTEGGTTIENVILPMSITETGKTNQTAANGEMKVWEAYVLGLDHTSATSKPIVSSAQTAEAGSIKLVDNLTPKTDAGVNVTRKLFVGTAPGLMSEVQDASYDNGFTVDVPTGDDKVKYLKIKYDFAAPQAQ